MRNLCTFTAEVRQQPVPPPAYLAVLRDDTLGMRDRIIRLEKLMKAEGCPVGDQLPLDHQFAPGTYARTIFMPKGSFVIGKIHRNACVNVMSLGSATVWTEYGEREITAPAVWISDPGTQRVVHMHEDVIWTTVHQNPDNLTDLEVLEGQVILPDYSAISDMEVQPEVQTLEDAS